MLQELFTAIQERCTPREWSRGVELTRRSDFLEDIRDKERISLRLLEKGSLISRVITLWPEDGDWQCDCAGEEDPCTHVIASVIALKQENKVQVSKQKPQVGTVGYRLKRKGGLLALDRILMSDGKSAPLASGLFALSSGKVPGPKVSATKEDLSIDHLVKDWPNGLIPQANSHQLLALLENALDIQLDGKKIKTSALRTGFIAQVQDEPGGVRVQGVQDPSIVEIFRNGIALCRENTLRPLENSKLTPDEIKMLAAGRHFGTREITALVSEILPTLEKKISVEILSNKLPQSLRIAPRVVFETEAKGDPTDKKESRLLVTPKIVYGDPVLAEVRKNDLISFGSAIPIRDLAAEKNLQFKLYSDLSLTAGLPLEFSSRDAVSFLEKIKSWEGGRVSGDGANRYRLYAPLQPKFTFTRDEQNADHVSIYFLANDPEHPGQESPKEVAASEVLKAWEANEPLVPLLDGGYAPMPADWLQRYGLIIKNLLQAQQEDGELKTWMAGELAELAQDLGTDLPNKLTEALKELSQGHIYDPVPLPTDLTASLRSYQSEGVRWLHAMKRLKLGAILSDDMGLGKTLQTICILGPKSLVIAPTSVVYNWEAEIKRFRPDLSVCIYHGTHRKLDTSKDVVLTTYAILRLDLESLIKEQWSTVVLDEAQNIKNAESQTAKAVTCLHAHFKLALTGTPIENSLEDVWSIFHFLNRGLLGTLKDFNQWFVRPIVSGDAVATTRLKERLKPFILRRLKSQVAKELPPRTDVVLYCELSEHERRVYDGILMATREEVLNTLNRGGNMLQVLEVLLRLRQASCHTGLIPGQESTKHSAKIDLLMASLSECLAENHKCLVFSQWTSLLDLIEPELKKHQFTYARIDGSTKNRKDIVSSFQSTPETKVLLLSLKAAGVGLNLTAADHVYILDPWWNPATEDQAADRAHRIGQNNPVIIHRLVAKGTVEEKILLLQNRKREIAQSIIGDQLANGDITKEDLMNLLEVIT